mgnify:CR=1 FL=1
MTWVTATDLGSWTAAFAQSAALAWVETPANPLLELTDIAAVCELAHLAGAKVVVDNTVATPLLTRPLLLGADFVFHSATKSDGSSSARSASSPET